ncbi:hypothetical protein BGZ54_009590 [Gamsiella multidivaricata]|nr:hypothetical protein BGZ54_009590 [Gamsiella multidivaricata]
MERIDEEYESGQGVGQRQDVDDSFRRVKRQRTQPISELSGLSKYTLISKLNQVQAIYQCEHDTVCSMTKSLNTTGRLYKDLLLALETEALGGQSASRGAHESTLKNHLDFNMLPSVSGLDTMESQLSPQEELFSLLSPPQMPQLKPPQAQPAQTQDYIVQNLKYDHESGSGAPSVLTADRATLFSTSRQGSEDMDERSKSIILPKALLTEFGGARSSATLESKERKVTNEGSNEQPTTSNEGAIIIEEIGHMSDGVSTVGSKQSVSSNKTRSVRDIRKRLALNRTRHVTPFSPVVKSQSSMTPQDLKSMTPQQLLRRMSRSLLGQSKPPALPQRIIQDAALAARKYKAPLVKPSDQSSSSSSALVSPSTLARISISPLVETDGKASQASDGNDDSSGVITSINLKAQDPPQIKERYRMQRMVAVAIPPRRPRSASLLLSTNAEDMQSIHESTPTTMEESEAVSNKEKIKSSENAQEAKRRRHSSRKREISSY